LLQSHFAPPPGWASIKGFLTDGEADALFCAARDAGTLGPILEIGSYCGKSTLCLAQGTGTAGGVVFALDHHRGSEEHQPGELFFDPDLYDQQDAVVDTFREFRRNVERAGLSDRVIPIVTTSRHAAEYWTTPLAMVFIDGGHSLDAALSDYRCWAGHLRSSGILAIHDVYEDAAAGGQAPYAVYRLALDSGLFETVRRVDSLAILRKL
jgi:predicted O-methyltransferase YrrM